MSWILIKILSDLLASSNVIIAKVMLSNHVSERRLYILSVMIVSTPFAILGLIELANSTQIIDVLIALIVGMSYIASGHFYYRAISEGQPSRLSMLFRLGSVFTLILSIIILQESLTIDQYFGFALSFLGGTIILTERSWKNLGSDQSSHYALASALCGALSTALTVYLLRQGYSVWQTFTITRVGVIIGTIVLLTPNGTWTAVKMILNLRRLYSGTLLSEQIIRLISLYLQTISVYQIGSATLVAVLSGFMPLYVWLIGAVSKQEPIKDDKLTSRLLSLLAFVISSYLMAR